MGSRHFWIEDNANFKQKCDEAEAQQALAEQAYINQDEEKGMTYIVTKEARQQIANWLKKNDKRYSTRMLSDLHLNCWCSIAEDQMPTEVAVLEISASFSVTGSPITLNLTNEAFELYPEAA